MGFRVRFHLAKGDNYMKWQVKTSSGRVTYHNPEDVSLIMLDCKLRNRKTVAEKISKGANKSVCAWIECKVLIVIPTGGAACEPKESDQISYNPRVQPNWVGNGEDLDNNYITNLMTNGRKIYHNQGFKNTKLWTI